MLAVAGRSKGRVEEGGVLQQQYPLSIQVSGKRWELSFAHDVF